MIDMLPGQNSHMPSQGVAAERASPVRRSFRKDSNGAVEVATRVRAMWPPLFSSTFRPVTERGRFKDMWQPESLRGETFTFLNCETTWCSCVAHVSL